MRKIYSFLKGMSAVKSLFLSVLCLWAVASTAQITVSSGGSYSTIQAAVTAAAPGATITVPAGTYNETDIVIDKSLTIVGPWSTTSPNDPSGGLSPVSRGAEAIIKPQPGMPGTSGSTYHAAFIVRGITGNPPINVVIKGFTFQGGSPLQDGHSGTGYGLADIDFENNIVDVGQLIYGGYYWRDVTIKNNNFNNSTPFPGDVGLADAVYLLGGRNVDVSDNVIKTAFVGILVKGQDIGANKNAPINQILIQRNRVSTTTEEAIQIGELIVNATVSENVVTGASSVGGIRIYLPTVSGRVDIRNNTVSNTPAGVILTDGNADQAIYVNYNSLDLTNAKSVINNGTGPLKATCNWLGTADCGIISGRVSGNVVYSPFLQNGVDNAPATIGFQTSAPCAICCTLAASIASKTDVKCFGGNDGSVSFNVTGGTASAVSYSLNGGAATASSNPATGLIAGSYVFTIKDNNTNCTTTVPVTIGQPTAALAATETHTNVNCFGNATGSIDLSVSGGTGIYTYAWTASNGGAVPPAQVNSQDLTGLVAGTYTVIVTDANKCTTTKIVTISQPTELQISATGPQDIDCNHPTGSVTISASGGTPFNGGTYTGTGLITGLKEGANTLTVTDANGCSKQIVVTIKKVADIVVTAKNQTNVSCYGDKTGSVEITATGGSGTYTGAGIKNGLAAGTYTFEVTDAINGCKGSVVVTINQPTSALDAKAAITDATCAGANGAINLTVTGGTPSYSYKWTKSGDATFTSTSEDISNLTSGSYTVVITDSKMCSLTVTFTVNSANSNITLSATPTNVLCYGGSTGSIDLTVNGGVAPFTYVWTKTGTATQVSNVQDPSGLAAGTYTVVVTDANKCTATKDFTVSQPSAALSITATPTNINCTTPGAIDVSVTGGTTPYTYLWTTSNGVIPSGQSDDQDLTGLTAAGTYKVTVTDKNLCTASKEVTITKTDCPPPVCTLKASISSQTNVSCYGGSNGSITITAIGGVGTVVGTGTFSNLAAGNYSYKVTDANKCEAYVSFNITQPDELKITTAITAASCKGAADGSVKFTITGGTSPYTIKNVTTGASNLSNPVTGLKAGTYSFLITDKNGCCKTVSVCITEPATPCVIPCKVTVTTDDIPYCYCGSTKGSATFTFTGKAPFKYTITPCNISGTSSDNTEKVNLSEGKYTIKVTAADGCVSTATFTVDQTDPITGTIGVKLSTTFPGQKSNTIYVGYATQYATLSAENIKGGTAPYKYQWYPSTGLATPNDDETKATPNCTTTYTLVVTDAKGCRFYKCVTIKVVDVRCGAYNNKVLICCKGNTLCVDKNLVSGYLATGATLGSCGCDRNDDDDDHDGRDRNWAAGGDDVAAATSDEGKQVTTTSIGGVYPNPTGGIFRLSLEPLNVPVQIVVGDATGKPITTVSRINSTTAGQTVDFNLSNQPVGMYLVRVVQGQIKKTYKVFIVR